MPGATRHTYILISITTALSRRITGFATTVRHIATVMAIYMPCH